MEADSAQSPGLDDPNDDPSVSGGIRDPAPGEPLLVAQMLSKAVSREDVVIPANQPAPPLPSTASKPKGSRNSMELGLGAKPNVTSSPLESQSAIAASPEKSAKKQSANSDDLFSPSTSQRSNSHDGAPLKSPANSSAVVTSPVPSAATPATTPVAASVKSAAQGSDKIDMAALMAQAFSNTHLKNAKDTPSLASGVIGSGGSKAKAALSPDTFTFDTHFAPPPPPTRSSTSVRPAGVAVPPIPTSAAFGDFKQADFSDFKNSFGSTSPQDLDNVFGGAPPQISPKTAQGSSDPFGGQDASAFGADPFSSAA
ncbi:hypothetical protein HDU91_004413, partial [Kappamyces sp. JEL0680]